MQPGGRVLRVQPRIEPHPRGPEATSAARWTLLGVTLIGLLGFSLLCAGTVIDDSFIFARYAKHFVLYHDIVWNPGEPRVEGFSSWAWLAVYVVAESLAAPPLLVAKLCGLLVLAVLSWSVARTLARRAASLQALVPAALFVATAVDLGYYASTGMDQILWVLAAWFYICWLTRAGSVGIQHGVVAALAALVRPEGFLLLAPLSVKAFVGGDRRAAIRAGAAWAVVTGGLLFARWSLFDQLLPNAAAAKHLGGPLSLRILGGVLYLHEGFSTYLMIPLALWVASVAAGTRPVRAADPVWLHMAFAAMTVLFVVIAGGDDTVAFGDGRLLLVLIPSMAVVMLDACERFGLERGSWLVPVALALVVVFPRPERAFELLKQSTRATNLTNPSDLLTRWTDGFRPTPIHPLSAYLLTTVPRGEYIAVPWAGEIPYETDLPTIDLIGLNDAHIAHTRVRERGIDVRYDPDYVLARAPFMICENVHVTAPLPELGSLSDAELRQMGAWKTGQRELLRHPRLAAAYRIDKDAPGNNICFHRVTSK